MTMAEHSVTQLRDQLATLARHHRDCEHAAESIVRLLQVVQEGGAISPEQARQAILEWDAHQWPPFDAPTNEGLVRDILVALAQRDGLSLVSDHEDGPARNYELALRLGIGRVFDLEDA